MTYSPLARRVYGFDDDEPITFERVAAATHPDDAALTRETMRCALDPNIRAKDPYEYRVIGADGVERWAEAFGEASFDEIDGQVRATRYMGVIRDVTERRSREQAVANALEHTELALEAGDLAVWDYDLFSGRLQAGPALYAVLGFAPGVIPSMDDLRSGYPEGEEKKVTEKIGQALEAGEAGSSLRFQYVTPTKGLRWMELRCRFQRLGDGTPCRLIGVVADRTDAITAAHRQDILVKELNHRVKNTLAVVQSLAWSTFRSEPACKGALLAYEQRISALASAHDLLTESGWEAACLRAVIERSLAPHLQGDRIRSYGPEIGVTPQAAVAFALAINELATNAIKYGALSSETGRVDLIWALGDELELSWTEQRGPLVEAPSRRGFGSQLLERALARDLNGSIAIHFEPTGVRCRIVCPASNVLHDVARNRGEHASLHAEPPSEAVQ